MSEIDPKTLIERFRRAKDRRAVWEAHWQECYDFALPQRGGGLMQTMTPGAKRTDKLFDGTAPDAVDQLAASLLAQLTPPWARWFGFDVGKDVAPEDQDMLAAELERAETILQSHFDRANFAVEMMLRPVNAAEGRLDPDRLRLYDDELSYSESNGQALLRLGSRRLVSASCWWDPSYGSPEIGDASVIAALFTDEEGDHWLHRVAYLTHDPARVEETDEATQLCRQVADFLARNHLPAVVLETNGLGRFLPGLLRREISATGLACSVIEKASRRGKDLRIVEAFDAVLAAGRLHAHRGVWDTPFVTEMREWRPGGRSRDDGLDAVSGCLLSEPVRLSRLVAPPSGFKEPGRWRSGTGSFVADTDFPL